MRKTRRVSFKCLYRLRCRRRCSSRSDYWLVKWTHELLNMRTCIFCSTIIPSQRIEKCLQVTTSLSEKTSQSLQHIPTHTHTQWNIIIPPFLLQINWLALDTDRHNFASISIFITPFLRLLIQYIDVRIRVELKRADKQITYWIPKNLFDFYLRRIYVLNKRTMTVFLHLL